MITLTVKQKFMNKVVYRHLKPCGEVFYIGIGKSEKRAYSNYDRNKHWHNTSYKYISDDSE